MLTTLFQQTTLEVVIPPKALCLEQRDHGRHGCKEQHLVEWFFEKLKKFRRVLTRYDKLSIAFKASVMIAACLIWLQ